MAEDDENQVPDPEAEAGLTATDVEQKGDLVPEEQPTQLGSARFVFAAFFAAGLLIAYLSGEILASAWGFLADWRWANHAMPWLLRVAEDERISYTMAIGAIVGLGSVIVSYRKPKVRDFADEVASELTKVTWPDKDMVTTGTITVIVGVVIATVYIGLLDQLWRFLTNLVYGA